MATKNGRGEIAQLTAGGAKHVPLRENRRPAYYFRALHAARNGIQLEKPKAPWWSCLRPSTSTSLKPEKVLLSPVFKKQARPVRRAKQGNESLPAPPPPPEDKHSQVSAAMGKIEHIARSPRGLSHTIYSMYDAGVRNGSLWEFERDFQAAVGSPPVAPPLPWLGAAPDKAGKDLTNAFCHMPAGKEDKHRKSKSMSRAEDVRLRVRIVSHLYSSSFGSGTADVAAAAATAAAPLPAAESAYVSAFLPKSKVNSILDQSKVNSILDASGAGRYASSSADQSCSSSVYRTSSSAEKTASGAGADLSASRADQPGAERSVHDGPLAAASASATSTATATATAMTAEAAPAITPASQTAGTAPSAAVATATAAAPPTVVPQSSLPKLASFPLDLDDPPPSSPGSKAPSSLQATPRAGQLSSDGEGELPPVVT
eukprot:jgi/Mesvir1/12760/Mv22824-RA.1